MVIYIIVGSLAFAATLGGLIWLVFAISKRLVLLNIFSKKCLLFIFYSSLNISKKRRKFDDFYFLGPNCTKIGKYVLT